MAKFEKRIEARKLRKTGKGIGEIAKLLNISKSSSSSWCRDIQLSEEQVCSLKNKVIKMGLTGRLKGAESNKRKKREHILQAREDSLNKIASVSKRDLLMLGLGLYWAEGSKSTVSRFTFNLQLPFKSFV